MTQRIAILTVIMGIFLIMGTAGSVMAQDLNGYHVNINGQPTGPYDEFGLRQLVSQGLLNRNSLVWREGMINWIVAGTIEEFSALFTGAVPPPLVTAPPSQPDQAAYRNFTIGERWGTFGLNWLVPGLGFYTIMRDRRGGGVQISLGVSSAVCVIVGYSLYFSSFFSDDNFNIGTGFMYAGAGIAASMFIHNIVRSMTYNRPAPARASGLNPQAIDIAVIPGKNGIEKVALSYTLQF